MKLSNFFIALITVICLAVSLSYGLKPDKEYMATPSDYGIIYEEATIQTRDNLIIKGWFFPAQDTHGIANEIVGKLVPVPKELKSKPRDYAVKYGERRPTIVICDGDAGNMTFSIFYGYHFFTNGYNVLTFDWRGFGHSSEWPIEQDYLCYKEFIIDYDAAIDFLKQRPEVDTTKIGVLGFSTGAYLSFAIAAKRDDIAAYAGRALMSSFKDLISVLKKVDPSRTWKTPKNYPKGLIPINAAKDMKKPVFLVVGEKDVRTPPWMSEKIMKKLKGEKELWIVPGAEHGGQNGPELYNYPEFFMRVISFFNKYLMISPSPERLEK